MISLPLFRQSVAGVLGTRFALLAVVVIAALCWDGSRRARAAQSLIGITPVSAASFAPQIPVAPGSIAAIFLDGDVVAPGTVVIGNDSNPSTPEIELPTLLGNLSVEVHGRSAGIFFLSARQWNILLPGDLQPGTGPIVIRDVTGLIRAAGEIEIAPVVPAIFTANTNGEGAPAAFLIRVLGSGEQRIEPVAELDPVTQRFAPKPIDLERGDELVFLILYLTGARGIVDANETRILIGGAEYIPDFVGPAPGFAGLEQINLRLPRSLPVGLLQIGFVHLAGGRAANACEIEVAPPVGLPPSIRGLSKAESLAGEVIEITGTGFTPDSEVLISDATRRVHNAQMMESGSTSLKVVVPYGSGSGNLIVRNARGEASFPFRMRTSMSGIVQRVVDQGDGNEVRVGIRNVTIRMRQNDVEQTTMTGDDGSFLMPDVQPTARLVFEVDGTTNGLLPLPKDRRSLPILAERDNQYEGYIELKEISGPSASAGSNGAMTHQIVAPLRGSVESAQPSPVVFDPQGSIARFPDGTVLNNITATVLDPGRVPANLPPAQFSSTIVQLTTFGATLDPGGRLTFPNTDGYAANEVVTLYRFDQAAGSNTLGSFVAAGQARVTADGLRVETESNAIKETTYYFVSKPRKVTTIYGRVEEEIGGGVIQPARGALVQVRGQSIFSLTDQSGTYTLRNVPIPDAATLSTGFAIEVSFLRPDGTVDRVDREGVIPGIAGLTLVTPPIRIVTEGRTSAPVILAPRSLTVEAGRQSEFAFLAYARVAGRTLTDVVVTGAEFAVAASLGDDRYVLRLMPGADAAGAYKLELRASDSEGEMTAEMILLEVKAPQGNTPIAISQSLETNEDQPVNVMLSAAGGTQFRIVSDPRRGSLSGTAPNLTYTPEADFNGTDAFSFVVGNGTVESAAAVVTVNVRAVSDAPRLTVGERFTTNIGQRLAVVINGYDGDAEQKLTLTGTGLPTGALIRQTTATSWVLEWRPTSGQIGSYSVNLTLSDDGTPMLSDAKTMTIVVEATWAPSITLGNYSPVQALAVAGDSLFAGTSEGVYRSIDNGVTWVEANDGLPVGDARLVDTLLADGGVLFSGTNGAGVYRSIDNGATWVEANNGLPVGDARLVKALLASGGMHFAGTEGAGIYRSSDNGMTWVQASGGLPAGDARRVYALSANGGVLLAGTRGSGIYRSTDGGTTWAESNNGLPTGNPRRVNCLLAVGGMIFAGTDEGVFRSGDNGAMWVAAGEGLKPPLSIGAALPVSSLAVSGGTLLAGTGGGVYRSNNNGELWSVASNGLPVTLFGFVAVSSLTVSGGAVFAGLSDGVYRSVDQSATWVETSKGLPVGRAGVVRSLAANAETLFAATFDSVYRSVDGGATWMAANSGLPSSFDLAGFVTSLTGGGGAVFAGTSGSGIYRSTNNGASWAPANNGLPQGGELSVSSLLATGGDIFAGTSAGVYRSVDGGMTWASANNGLGERTAQCLSASGGILFAGAFDRVYRSADNGGTWVEASNGLPGGFQGAVLALTSSGGTLFAGTSGSGIFRSADNGTTWVEASEGLPAGDARLVLSLATSGGAIFAGTGGGGIYRSADDGMTWTEANVGLPSGDAREVNSLVRNGEALYAGTNGAGVFILAESEIVWELRREGLSNSVISAAVTNGEALVVGTFGGGVFRSIDDGLNWMAANSGLPPNARVQTLIRTANGVFGGLLGAGVYFSSDLGQTWAARNGGLANLRVKALASDGAMLYAGTEGGVFGSTNEGVNWTSLNSGLTDLRVLSLAVAGNAIYAGTENGLFRSQNGGASWTAINTGLGNRYITALGIAPDGNTVVAGTAIGLYRSTSGGANWVQAANGISDRVVALVFAASGTRLLAGTIFGYYVSEDQGVSWRPRNTGLLNLQVGALAVKGERVFAGTRGAGVFVSRLE